MLRAPIADPRLRPAAPRWCASLVSGLLAPTHLLWDLAFICRALGHGCAQGIAALLQNGVSGEGYESECDFYILVFMQDTIMSVASTIALVRSCPQHRRRVRTDTDADTGVLRWRLWRLEPLAAHGRPRTNKGCVRSLLWRRGCRGRGGVCTWPDPLLFWLRASFSSTNTRRALLPKRDGSR